MVTTKSNANWDAIQEQVYNHTKIYLLTHYVDEILMFYAKQINYLVFKYIKYLPYHVAQAEEDDLRTIANLEFIEVLKVWRPEQNDNVWPLARLRMVGAMKDHIRYVTKSDPTRFYDWITDAAHLYTVVNDRGDFEHHIETGIELNNAMKILTQREQVIVINHTKKDQTFKQIGLELSVSESQVSRIYKKAIEKIKKEISATKLPPVKNPAIARNK